MRLLAIVGAFSVWAALSYAFVFVFVSGHVCAILQPVGAYATASPIPVDVLTARCDRPDVGAIAASIGGLVAIVVAVVYTRPAAPGR